MRAQRLDVGKAKEEVRSGSTDREAPVGERTVIGARAFCLLEAMADAGGVCSLSQLRAESDLPLATIHRLLQTLVVLGYVRQGSMRTHALGPRLARLADGATGLMEKWAAPYLRELSRPASVTAEFGVRGWGRSERQVAPRRPVNWTADAWAHRCWPGHASVRAAGERRGSLARMTG